MCCCKLLLVKMTCSTIGFLNVYELSKKDGAIFNPDIKQNKALVANSLYYL